MDRALGFVLSCLIAAHTVAAAPPEPTSPPAGSEQEAREAEARAGSAATELSERNDELLKKHTEIWGLMGLSSRAREELNEIVVSINTNLYKNRSTRPEAFEKEIAVQPGDEPLTYERFISDHEQRFKLLAISEPTEAELLAALDFTWKALHEPDVPEEKREVAKKIRDMMKSMGGPPPCCDDSIFERAGMAH